MLVVPLQILPGILAGRHRETLQLWRPGCLDSCGRGHGSYPIRGSRGRIALHLGRISTINKGSLFINRKQDYFHGFRLAGGFFVAVCFVDVMRIEDADEDILEEEERGLEEVLGRLL